MNATLAELLTKSLGNDAAAFLPELVLCGAIVVLLLIRLVPRYDGVHLGWVALGLSAFVCYLACEQWVHRMERRGDITAVSGADVAPILITSDGHGLTSGESVTIRGVGGNTKANGTATVTFVDANQFTIAGKGNADYTSGGVWSQSPDTSLTAFGGMLVFDNFTVFIKVFLYGFVTLVILLTLLTGIPDKEDSADFFCLLFGATIGMTVMASASHLLMVFIGIEMASLPSYALAGFLKGRRQSSEAALKYVVYGGGASGVMLYGISLLAGKFDSGFLPTIVREIGAGNNLTDPVVIMGLTFLLLGVGFKLASVPFHFWCPDVFEGAAAEVGAFLSVASKGAALALLARVALGVGGLTTNGDIFVAWTKATDYLVPALSIFAVVTTTFGNFAAYGQTNLKRLLAYSTIAHAGFMMMGLATLTRDGAGAVLFYLIAYLFMNLGAFAVVAFLRNLTGQEDLSYYRGFVYRSPVLVITLAVFLLSLLGMPPLAGFIAKFQIFSALYDGAQEYNRLGKPHLYWTLLAVLIAGGLNTVVSLFYYLKVLKVMVLEKTLEEVEDRPVEQKPAPLLQAVYASFLAVVLFVLGVAWNPLAEASSKQGVDAFRTAPERISIPPAKTPAPPKGGKGGGGKKMG
jgi:NADH-quinone oxidoreductase subunit N